MLGLLSIFTTYQLFLISLAILPAAYLMRYIYRQDRLDKEPASLLTKLVILGMCSAPVAAILETIGTAFLSRHMNPTHYYMIYAFLIVGVSEEVCKLVFLYLGSWRHRAFDYHFDGLVYAVYVSLGFAILENILYVFQGGVTTAIMRAVLSIPGHMCFAVPMGIFYSDAKSLEMRHRQGVLSKLLTGLLFSIFLHGLYDFCLMDSHYLLFIVVVIFIYLMIFYVIRNEANHDHYL